MKIGVKFMKVLFSFWRSILFELMLSLCRLFCLFGLVLYLVLCIMEVLFEMKIYCFFRNIGVRFILSLMIILISFVKILKLDKLI